MEILLIIEGYAMVGAVLGVEREGPGSQEPVHPECLEIESDLLFVRFVRFVVSAAVVATAVV